MDPGRPHFVKACFQSVGLRPTARMRIYMSVMLVNIGTRCSSAYQNLVLRQVLDLVVIGKGKRYDRDRLVLLQLKCFDGFRESRHIVV